MRYAILTLLLLAAPIGAAEYTVVNKCEPGYAVVNRCPAPPAPAAVVRSPVGHTHTCANGHTWDHTQDGGSHRCPVPGCGLTQFVVDATPRAVAAAPLTYQLAPGAAGGCASGNCPTTAAPSRGPGIFGGPGLFRR